jgi:uncharacterized membrane protein
MPALVGKILALASPVFAVGVVCFMLFATGYSYVSIGERAGSHEGDPVEAGSESGWVSAYEYSLEKGNYVYFFWSGFIVVICLLAAGAALKGWIGLVWACAGLLGLLTILGAMSIGGMVAPLALVLLLSAILLRLSGPEGS